MRLAQRQSARQLEVKRDRDAILRLDGADVVDLADLRDGGAAAWTRSRNPASSSGSTWTTTSVSGSARSIASSTASAAAWPCPTAASGATPMTTSAKCLPAACRIRRRRSCTGGSMSRIASCAASYASAGARSMSTSTFRRISRTAAKRTMTATNSAAAESASSNPARTKTSPIEDGRRAHEIAAEMERVRLERRTAVPPSGAQRHDHAAHVDHDHRADHRERVPGRFDARLRAPHDVGNRPPDDEDARGGEEARFRERREMLGLAVAVRVRAVGRTDGDADREERQERGDEVHARVQRFRDEAEAVGRETGNELERDERRRRADRDERRAALRIHGRRLDRLRLRGG